MMKTPLKYVVTGLAAVAVGGAVVLAPVASAAAVGTPVASVALASGIAGPGTDPLVPYGTEPKVPGPLGYVDSNHDEADTSNGQVDLPF
jgi:hypothetical protein